MDILGKVEAIRKKPEHIRIRYVWLMVGISMVFVVAIWAMSIQSSSKRSREANPEAQLQTIDLLKNLKEQKESVKDLTEGMKNNLTTSIEQELANQQNIANEDSDGDGVQASENLAEGLGQEFPTR